MNSFFSPLAGNLKIFTDIYRYRMNNLYSIDLVVDRNEIDPTDWSHSSVHTYQRMWTIYRWWHDPETVIMSTCIDLLTVIMSCDHAYVNCHYIRLWASSLSLRHLIMPFILSRLYQACLHKSLSNMASLMLVFEIWSISNNNYFTFKQVNWKVWIIYEWWQNSEKYDHIWNMSPYFLVCY